MIRNPDDALEHLAQQLRQTYHNAATVHLEATENAGHVIAEIYDAAGRRLDDDPDAELLDWQDLGPDLDLVALTHAVPVHRDGHEACRSITLPPAVPASAYLWHALRRTQQRLYTSAPGVYVFEARSDEPDHRILAAGVVRLDPATHPDAAARALRAALAQITGDPRVYVQAAPRDHPSGPAWSQIGDAGPED